MCRNIKRLYNFEPPATEEEMEASALQYVRKLSGMTSPSEANREAFDRAVAEITAITKRLLLEELVTTASPRDRDVEAERARERGRQREARLLEKLTGH
ncbi:MAG: DUF2277 domain-containing protein [Alphaproteobacteria bacterium]|nr:DUF2277 domain-containing protein [Alphaproteobacteria bacterium]